tara:strand:- start:5152 stop:6291 length:1140 start_codon:yes stop_codon:yes gene_type:complete
MRNKLNKLKVLTVLGTRPEIIRLSRIIKKLETNFQHFLIHTNQNFDTNLKDNFLKELGIKPNLVLKKNSSSTIRKIADILNDTDVIIKKFKPDAFLILGDTNSALSAISAKKNKIPIFHIEAGNRCFNQNVPEEINRKIVDHISDINLTYSDFAKKNLIREGIPSDQVFKIGSPLYEVINHNKENIDENFYLKKNSLIKKKFFLISFHRDENIQNNNRLNNFIKFLKNLEKKYKMKIIISTHPRLKEKLLQNKAALKKNIIFSKPFGYFEYLSLQKSALLVLSDSGSITEEAGILKIPAISLRNDIERQEGMDETIIMMSELNTKSIFNSINILLNTHSKNFPLNLKDYSKPNVSDKLVRIINNYVSFINRRVWMKKND